MHKVGFSGLVLLTLAAGCSSSVEEPDAQVTGESQDHLLAGRRLTEAQVAALLRRAGFPESAVGKMVCTAKWESNFYERAQNHNKNGTTDYGLFQINSIHLRDGAGCPSSAAALYDVTANTACALHVFRIQGIDAWYGYKNHRSECERYRAPPSTAAVPGADDTDTTTTDPAAQDAGGCWSATYQDMEPAGACVQSAFDGIWYQCHAGGWYRGGDDVGGPYGMCTSLSL